MISRLMEMLGWFIIIHKTSKQKRDALIYNLCDFTFVLFGLFNHCKGYIYNHGKNVFCILSQNEE